jgi:hypothetical protein
MRYWLVVLVGLALPIPVAGAAEQDMRELPTWAVRQMLPSPDGRWLAMGMWRLFGESPWPQGRGICIISTDTGEIGYFRPPGPDDTPGPEMLKAWSPDSRALLTLETRPPLVEAGPPVRVVDAYRDLHWLVERDERDEWTTREVHLPSDEDIPFGLTFMLPGEGSEVCGAVCQPDGTRRLIVFDAATGAVTRRVGTVPAYHDIRSPQMRLGHVYFAADEAIMPEELRTNAEAWQKAYAWAVDHVPQWRWRSVELATSMGRAHGQALAGRLAVAAVSLDCSRGALIPWQEAGLGTGELLITDLAAGGQTHTVKVPPKALSAAWDPSGSRLILYDHSNLYMRRGTRGGLWVVDAAAQHVTQILPEETQASAAAWSADGTSIHFADGPIVWSLNLETGKRVKLFDAFDLSMH